MRDRKSRMRTLTAENNDLYHIYSTWQGISNFIGCWKLDGHESSLMIITQIRILVHILKGATKVLILTGPTWATSVVQSYRGQLKFL